MFTFYEIVFACLVVFGGGLAAIFYLKKKKNRDKINETLTQAEANFERIKAEAEAKIKEKLQ